MSRRPNDSAQWRTAFAVITAVAIVAFVSVLPLRKLTDGLIDDYNLLADVSAVIESQEQSDTIDVLQDEAIDPLLRKAIAESRDAATNKTVAARVDSAFAAMTLHTTDSAAMTKPDAQDTVVSLPDAQPALRDENGIVAIEDYTPSKSGLSAMKSALMSGRMVRIAVVGDSYIEGDIFTQDLREKLQSRFGGSGVGYVSMHTDFPGFRRSVHQGGSGWNAHKHGEKGTLNAFVGLSQHYFTPKDGARALSTYKGDKKIKHVDQWEISRFLFVAPDGATVTMTDSDGENHTSTFAPSSSVQSMVINKITGSISLSTSTSSIKALGVWLESSAGVSVECMSTRGFSGLSLSSLNYDLCRQMDEKLGYDMIILEFGLNAMSASQKNYSVYSREMIKVIRHLRECFPSASIILMGVGDRGQKRGGELHSMSTVGNMVSAQRDAAREAGCLFWDIREAQGGNDAVVEWSRKGLIGKDYTHMSHKGGKVLAEEFYNALMMQLQ